MTCIVCSPAILAVFVAALLSLRAASTVTNSHSGDTLSPTISDSLSSLRATRTRSSTQSTSTSGSADTSVSRTNTTSSDASVTLTVSETRSAVFSTSLTATRSPSWLSQELSLTTSMRGSQTVRESFTFGDTDSVTSLLSTTRTERPPSSSLSETVQLVEPYDTGATQKAAIGVAVALLYAGSLTIGGSVAVDSGTLIAVMQVSACGTEARTFVDTSTLRRQAGGFGAYALSPLWDYGYIIAAYGNLALVLVATWLHAGLLLSRAENEKRKDLELALRLAYGLKDADDIVDEEKARRKCLAGIRGQWHVSTLRVASQLRFPSLSLRVFQALLPGTTFCSMAFLINGDENSSGLAGVLAALMCAAILAAWQLFLVARIVPCLQFAPHYHPTVVPNAVTPFRNHLWVARMIPTHGWEPEDLRLSFGELYNVMTERYKIHRVVEVLVLGFVGGLAAIAVYGSGLSCIVGCGGLVLIFVGAALLNAFHGYYRVPLFRCTEPIKNIVFAVMCGLKVSSFEVPSTLNLVQALFILAKAAYCVWISMEERRMRASAAQVEIADRRYAAHAERDSSVQSSKAPVVDAADRDDQEVSLYQVEEFLESRRRAIAAATPNPTTAPVLVRSHCEPDFSSL